MDCQKISVVIAFYKGNRYMERLFASFEKAIYSLQAKIDFEIILVNDSPEIEIKLPENISIRCIKIINNEKNVGIQSTRVNGIKQATGDWILILDQDDELVANGFEKQLKLTSGSDVVVGNGLYQYGDEKRLIYKNKRVMDYLIQKEHFLEIRNLIPSPGECLIRKSCFPQEWMDFPLKHNGADDWLLWILLFQKGCKFVCNEEIVYIHNDTGGQNLSQDLNKMHTSAIEMCKVLEGKLDKKTFKKLYEAVEFKYLQDSKKMTIFTVAKHIKPCIRNMIYKVQILFK